MPIDTKHPQYNEYSDLWQTCRDVAGGERRVKAAGRRYLPEVSAHMSAQDYNSYKARASFFGATGRTIQGLSGLVGRKSPEVTAAEALLRQFRDVTLTGIPLAAFSQMILKEILTVGRIGILVEMPAEPSPENRPYFAWYTAEQIVNWRTTRRQGREILSWVVLHENESRPKDGDEFETATVERYRLLELDGDGFYRSSVWKQSPDKREWMMTEEYIPQIRGNPMTAIPFTFINSSHIMADCEKPPLLDLADLTLSHYRTSADLEHGRHFTALPMVVLTGFDVNDKSITLGSSQALISPNADARAQYLEFTGQGLGALEKAIEQKTEQMATLGASLIQPQKRAVETAESLRIRQAGETAALKEIVLTISHGLTTALQFWKDFVSVSDGTVACVLNLDFLDLTMNPQELTALMALWQAGAISHRTLYRNLAEGEITRPGISAEAEKHEIAAEGVL